MKKKYISFLLSALLLGGFTSCSDWLDVEQNIEKDAEEMFDTYDGFKGALTGCYSDLAKTDLYGTRMTMSNVDALASLWYMDGGIDYRDNIQENYYLRVHDYSQTMTQDVFQTLYSNLYNAVLETSMVIKAFRDGKGSSIPDAASRAVVEGEAYGLRAFLHLDILRLFGQVPNNATIQVSLPYSEITSYEEDLNYCTFDEYVTKLKADIEQAKALLKDNDPIFQYTLAELNELGDGVSVEDDFMTFRQYRMNYWAVRALEARMYMYLGDKTTAHDIAMEVINATTVDGDPVVTLSSATDYGQATNRRYMSPSECLFSLYFDNLYDISVPLLHGIPTSVNSLSGVNRQDNLTLTTSWKADLFQGCDANDIRSRFMWADTRDGQSDVYPSISKYYVSEESPAGVIPLLRLSEMYLIAIEGASTLAEANTLYSTYMISKEVSRTDYFKSMDEVMTELPKEYRREFFAEGQMFYYYKRNNTRNLWSNESMTMDEGLYIIPNPDTDF